MKRILIVFAVAFGLLLAGCGSNPASTAPTGATAVESLQTAKRTLVVAESAALVYIALPLCRSPQHVSGPCAEPKIVVQLNEANRVAVAAIRAADDAVKGGAPNVDVLLASALAAATSYNANAQAAKP